MHALRSLPPHSDPLFPAHRPPSLPHRHVFPCTSVYVWCPSRIVRVSFMSLHDLYNYDNELAPTSTPHIASVLHPCCRQRLRAARVTRARCRGCVPASSLTAVVHGPSRNFPVCLALSMPLTRHPPRSFSDVAVLPFPASPPDCLSTSSNCGLP